MTKIALTAAALLVATGAAFAGSDHYGSDGVNQPAVTQSSSNVDRTVTGSISNSVQRDLHITPDSNQAQSGQGNWGNH